jgi:hypothetical protein
VNEGNVTSVAVVKRLGMSAFGMVAGPARVAALVARSASFTIQGSPGGTMT